MDPQLVLSSKSPEHTLSLGKCLGELLKRGDVVSLIGDLGAGKTTLTQGISDGLGVSEKCYVTSPTFTIINEYMGRVPVYHLDFYRIDSPSEVEDLGLEEYFQSKGVALVEWANKIKPFLPEDCLMVFLEHVDYTVRKISMQGTGKRYREVLREIETKIYETAGCEKAQG